MHAKYIEQTLTAVAKRKYSQQQKVRAFPTRGNLVTKIREPSPGDNLINNKSHEAGDEPTLSLKNQTDGLEDTKEEPDRIDRDGLFANSFLFIPIPDPLKDQPTDHSKYDEADNNQ